MYPETIASITVEAGIWCSAGLGKGRLPAFFSIFRTAMLSSRNVASRAAGSFAGMLAKH